MRIPKTPLIAAALAVVCVASAQTKPAAKPKTAAPASAARPVLGTAQLPGDDGKLGQAYTMGGENKVNLVLTGVRYAKARWNHGDASVMPTAAQKLMILSYQIQNPNKAITPYDGGLLRFTAIDQEGENHEGTGSAIQKNGAADLAIGLKPAQRIDCETAIVVPAKGMVPKLMVAHRNGGAVLRYDLHDAIAPLDKALSANGYDASETVSGQPDTYYPLLGSDVRYASTEFQEDRIGDNACGAKEIYMLARLTFKVQASARQFMRFEGEAIDEDGERYPGSVLRKASSEEFMGSYAQPGQELNARLQFVLPKGAKIAKFRLWEGQGTGTRSEAIEFAVGKYATVDGEPLKKADKKTPVEEGDADAYTTTLNKGDGTTKAMEFEQVVRRDATGKTTLITAGGRRAILVEGADGTTTLAFPDTKETLRAPRATGKDPVTSLDYYEMAYANAVAPKKRKSLLATLAPAAPILLTVVTGGAAAALMGGGMLAGLGGMAAPALVQGATTVVQGVAMRQMQAKLGRATMSIQQPADPSGARLSDDVTIDGKTFASTAYKGRVSLDVACDASAAKDVDAKEMYKRFTEFMTKGLG